MSDPLLYITDGDTSVNLLAKSAGIFLNEWTPSIAPLKGGGTYQQSVMAEGKQLVMTNYDNAVETFNLKIAGESQDAAIRTSQELLRLLEKARAYWTVRFETNPVWLVARAPNETNTRYAIIHNYQQSGLDNPYAQPFFGCVDATMDDITLVVERGHWSAQIPGQPDCAAITASSDDSIERLIESVTTDTDDAYVEHTGSSIDTASTLLRNGYWAGPVDYDSGFRFSSVDVGDEETINAVYLRLVCGDYPWFSGGFDQGDIQFRVFGEDADAGATFSTYANFVGRTLTDAYTDFYPDRYSVGDVVLINVTDIFNEIRARGGWSDGDPMVFIMQYWSRSGSGEQYFAQWSSFENLSYDEPQLLIDYSEAKGEAVASCASKNYVTDKYNQAALTHIYVDDSGAFSANLVDSTAFDILPDPSSVNDAIYFGLTFAPFTNVVMNIAVAQEDLTIVWEYYQGAPTSGWVTLPANDLKDNTNTFQSPGYKSVTFAPPRDTTNGSWDTYDISGEAGGPAVTAYWIRARVTAIGGSPVIPETSTIACYTVTWPYVSIAEDEILGDISALAAATLTDAGIRQTGKLRRDRLIIALQSDRGPYAGQNYNFSAYLPYSDEQLPSVIESINGVSGDFSYATDVTTPSGRAILLNPSGTGTDSVYTTVDSSNFFGKYRVFARIRQQGGSDNHFFFQVTTQHGSTVYASTNESPSLAQSTTTDPFWQLLDLGELSIPTGLPARMADESSLLDIYMNIRVEDTTGDVYLCDLILMPADEWIADVQDFGDGNWAVSSHLLVDSAYVPKADIRGLSRLGGAYANPIPFKTIAGKFTLPANKASKLWMVSARWYSTDGVWLSDPGIVSKVRLYKSERYLGLRGNR